MKKTTLKGMTTEQLVARFVEIGVAQDHAILRDQTHTFNDLFGRMIEVEDELKRRDGDQRRALIPLYRHPNMQVRLNSAKATLAVAPLEARQALEAIRATQWQPQAGDAGMSLWNLDRGVFRPK